MHRLISKDWYAQIDILINNAGVMACPEARTSEGFEMQVSMILVKTRVISNSNLVLRGWFKSGQWLLWLLPKLSQYNLPDWRQPLWPLSSDKAAFAPVEESSKRAWVSRSKGCNSVVSRSHRGEFHTSVMAMIVIVQEMMKRAMMIPMVIVHRGKTVPDFV